MAERKVSVWLVGKDGVSAVLQSTRKGIAAWAGHVTKIAAGIGLADGFKQIGRFIGESVKMAAEAYPKLGASLGRVSAAFTEFRIQAGAAFLQVLQPAMPLFERAFEWASKLAVKLPDAFDGARIMLARFVGFFRELPGLGQQAFGKLAQSAAEFVEKAGFVLSLFGSDAGINAADRLNAFAAAQQQAGIISQRNAGARTDAIVAGIASTVRTPGARAAVETDDAKKAREAAEREAAQQLARNLARQREERLAAGGGGNVIGTAGPAPLDPAIPDILKGATTEMYESARAAEYAARAGKSLSQSFEEVSTATLGIGEALGAINTSILGSIPGFGQVAKAAQKAIGIIAKVEGGIAIAQGAVKVAKSIFPFNPAELSSGLAMIREGSKLSALGGGGGGGVGGRSGGLGSGQFTRDQRAGAEGRERTRAPLVFPPGMWTSSDNPDFQDFIRHAYQGGEARA